MINLARRIDRDNPQVDTEVNETVRAELTAAGIEIEEHDFLIRMCGEVPTKIIGSLAGWSFRRAWRYWVAEGPGVPPEEAEQFHRIWGQQVRVAGHAGCPSPLAYYHGFAVGSYHIDTQEGLNAFADLLRSIYAIYMVEVPT